MREGVEDGAPGRFGGEPDERLPPAPWHWWEILPVFVIAVVLGGLGAVAVAGALSSCGARFVAAALVGEIGFVVAVLAWIALRHRGGLPALGLLRNPVAGVGAGVLGGALLTVLGFVSSIVVFTVARLVLGEEPPRPEQIAACVRGEHLALAGVMVTVAAPIAEELFFRGFFFRALRTNLTLWPAALISGAVFAVVHAEPLVIFALFPVGVGLAVLYERRGTLIAPIVAHAVFNVVGFLTIAAERA